jgi:hypothetical protein
MKLKEMITRLCERVPDPETELDGIIVIRVPQDPDGETALNATYRADDAIGILASLIARHMLGKVRETELLPPKNKRN